MSGDSSAILAKEYCINQASVLNYVKYSGNKPRSIQEHGHKIRKAPGVAAANATYKYYKSGAKWRNLSMDISKDDFFVLVLQNCYYCGAQPSNKRTTSNGSFVYNGLDRVDPKIGYNIANVVPCCIDCNIAKSNMTMDEFMCWLRKAASYSLWKTVTNLPLVFDEIP